VIVIPSFNFSPFPYEEFLSSLPVKSQAGEPRLKEYPDNNSTLSPEIENPGYAEDDDLIHEVVNPPIYTRLLLLWEELPTLLIVRW